MNQQLRYIGDEQAQRSEILRSNSRPYPSCCGVPMLFTTWGGFGRLDRPHFLCVKCKKDEPPAFWPLMPYTFPVVEFQMNNVWAVLKDATWFPYAPTDKYNPHGDNGYLLGTVAEGQTTSRLFHAVSHQAWTVGVPHRADYFALSHIQHSHRHNFPIFVHHTCG